MKCVRGTPVPASPAAALPVVTFSAGVTFHLNGDDIRVIHVAHAHTDGDALVYWTHANVLHMGDTFFNGLIPFIDLDSGGSIDGAIVAVEAGLALANDAHGDHPPATADRPPRRPRPLSRHAGVPARPGPRRDAPPTQPRPDQGARLADRYGPPDGFISPDRMIETIYQSLSHPPADHD